MSGLSLQQLPCPLAPELSTGSSLHRGWASSRASSSNACLQVGVELLSCWRALGSPGEWLLPGAHICKGLEGGWIITEGHIPLQACTNTVFAGF